MFIFSLIYIREVWLFIFVLFHLLSICVSVDLQTDDFRDDTPTLPPESASPLN